MAVKSVHFGEIVEVTFKFPGEGYKVHPALVISGSELQEDEHDPIIYYSRPSKEGRQGNN